MGANIGNGRTLAFAGCGHTSGIAFGSFVPILLQKSFFTGDQKFFWS
jgi:hypothetical protein